MSQFFISYSRKDLAITEKIINALAKDGLEPWIDWKSIPKGEKFEDEIYKGIVESEAFLFLISPDSVQSDWCKKEINRAVQNGKRILPIVIRDADPEKIHPETSGRNWIFCRDGQDDFDTAIQETYKTIHTDFGWLRYHTKLQVKALDWEQRKDNSRLLRGNELTEAEQQLAGIDSKKDPQPTDTQRQYIAFSREVENQEIERLAQERANTKRRLRNLGIAIGTILIVAVITSVLAVVLRGQIGIERTDKERAKEIALANQLVSQAQPMFVDGNPKQMTAVLLAIQSMHLNPSGEAAYILQNNTLAKPITQLVYDGAKSIAFSPDGKYIVAGSMYSMAGVWEISSGAELAQVLHYGYGVDSAFDPSGRYVISGSDRIVKIWHAETGKEIANLDIQGLVNDFAISLDGNYAATAEQYNVRVWEIMTGKEIISVSHADARYVDFSPNGRYIVSGGGDNYARVWELSTGKEISRLNHENKILSVAFSPNNRLLASSYKKPGKSQNIIIVWEVNTGNIITSFTHEDNVTSISFSPDSAYLVSGSDDNTARVWEVATGIEVARVLHGGDVNSVAFSSDGYYVASGSDDYTARVWEADSGKEIARITHNNAVDSVVFSPDDKYLASASARDNSISIWELATGNDLLHVKKDKNVETVLSPDNTIVALGDVLGNTYVLDAGTGMELAVLSSSEHDGSVRFVKFSPDSRYLLTGSGPGTMHIWDIVSEKEIVSLKHDAIVTDAAFSPNGEFIVSGSQDKTARIWSTVTGREVGRKLHDEFVYSVGFSPDGKYVVTGSNTACVWDASTGEEIICKYHGVSPKIEFISFMSNNEKVLSFEGLGNIYVWETLTGETISKMRHDENAYVTSIDFTSDGMYVVSGSNDSTARVWEVSTGKEISRMTHEGLVNSVTFSNSSQYVVSASQDGTIRVWEAMTGKEVARKLHNGYISFVTFNNDDSLIYSGGCLLSQSSTCLQGGVSVWWYRSEDLINNACSYVTRNLSNEEWEQYIGDALPYQKICPNLPNEPDSIPTP